MAAEDKLSSNEKSTGRRGCGLTAMFVLLAVAYCAQNVPKSEPTGDDEEENPFADVSKREYWIIQSKDTITSRLRDPDSADFRNSRFYSGGDVPVTCGEVNAKNALGGYTGFERFIAAGPSTDLAFTASDFAAGDSIDNVWERLCVLADGDEAYVP